MTRVCDLCATNPAELPDRNRMGRPIKRVCKPCHALRLTGDLQAIMEMRQARINKAREEKGII